MIELGTDFREDRIVRGTCGQCGEDDALLYQHPEPVEGDVLMCADCSRKRAKARPVKQACDNCGDTGNVWRDPKTRKNEYLCIKCHDPNAMFQNRWADKVRPRESKGLGIREKVECEASGYGTDCKGEIKWRSAHKKSLCNKHAGKQGVGPNG